MFGSVFGSLFEVCCVRMVLGILVLCCVVGLLGSLWGSFNLGLYLMLLTRLVGMRVNLFTCYVL